MSDTASAWAAPDLSFVTLKSECLASNLAGAIRARIVFDSSVTLWTGPNSVWHFGGETRARLRAPLLSRSTDQPSHLGDPGEVAQ